jgi:hypothetical protein
MAALYLDGASYNTPGASPPAPSDAGARRSLAACTSPSSKWSTMANTSYYKTHVEPFVRGELHRLHGRAFSSQVLRLPTGGTHEFDAVADDGSIIASIKSLSGNTSGGKRPAGKYAVCLAELYF